VGVNAAIASENGFYQGYGFAIPANLARVVANQLIADGRVRRSILGVSISDADEDDAAYAGLDEVRGVVLNDYSMDDSPAERAGLRPGDLIVELDGEPVYYVAQLQQLVGFKRPGETVQVTVVRRGGERQTFTVRLIEAPIEDQAQVAMEEESEPEPEVAGTATALGIDVRQPPREVAEQLGAEHSGPLVTGIELTSPAQERLLPARNNAIGDVITHVNGTRVRSIDDFKRAVAQTRPGDIVSMRVFNPGAGQSRVERFRIPE
jgi:serine protease Do